MDFMDGCSCVRRRFPALDEARCEILRPCRDPGLDFRDGKPGGRLDFGRRKPDRPAVTRAVKPDMLPAGFLARRDAADFLRFFLHADAHFLVELAHGGRRIVLAGIQMPGNAGVPDAGMGVLEHRALLEQQIAAFVENEHMHRAVQQLLRMHLAAGLLAGDLIVFIHHIEDLAGFLRQVLERIRIAEPGELHPLGERQFLRTRGDGHSEILRDFLPRGALRELFLELLPPLGESPADQFIEQAVIERRQSRGPRTQNRHAESIRGRG